MDDEGGSGDEAHHAHLASAAGTHEGSTSYTRRIKSAHRRLRAARSAPCGVVSPSGASPGEEGSAGAAAFLRLAAKLAALVVLAADPSADIANLRKLRHVMRGGVLRSVEELAAIVPK